MWNELSGQKEVIHKDLAPRISIIDDNFMLRAKPIPLQSLVPHGLSLSGEQQKHGIDGWLLKVWLKMSSPTFPGDPVAKTPHSQWGPGFDPWWGNWILHATTKKSACCY